MVVVASLLSCSPGCNNWRGHSGPCRCWCFFYEQRSSQAVYAKGMRRDFLLPKRLVIFEQSEWMRFATGSYWKRYCALLRAVGGKGVFPLLPALPPPPHSLSEKVFLLCSVSRTYLLSPSFLVIEGRHEEPAFHNFLQEAKLRYPARSSHREGGGGS